MKSVPTDDIKLIELVTDTMSFNNNHKKVDINDIMREFDSFYISNKLEKYKPFIIEYANKRNSEAEVMYIDFF